MDKALQLENWKNGENTLAQNRGDKNKEEEGWEKKRIREEMKRVGGRGRERL